MTTNGSNNYNMTTKHNIITIENNNNKFYAIDVLDQNSKNSKKDSIFKDYFFHFYYGDHNEITSPAQQLTTPDLFEWNPNEILKIKLHIDHQEKLVTLDYIAKREKFQTDYKCPVQFSVMDVFFELVRYLFHQNDILYLKIILCVTNVNLINIQYPKINQPMTSVNSINIQNQGKFYSRISLIKYYITQGFYLSGGIELQDITEKTPMEVFMYKPFTNSKL